MTKEKTLKFRYNAVINTINGQGDIVKTTKVHNLIVDVGLDKAMHLIANIASGGFGHMAIGEGTTSPVAGDTELETEQKRAAVVASDTGVGIVLYDHTFTFVTGETFAITEAGLFDSLTPTGSTMLNRFTFASHTVDVDNSLQVLITLTLANA